MTAEQEFERDKKYLPAMEKLATLCRAYERQYGGDLTVGKVLEMENAALEEQEARNSRVVIPQWRTDVIELRLAGGSTTKVEAEILGQWAVHVALSHRGRPRPKYSLTHLETSFLIQSGLALNHAKYLAERFAYYDWTLVDGKPSHVTNESCWVIVQAAHLLKLWKKAAARKVVGMPSAGLAG